MNQRDLSEKLEELAKILEENSDDYEVLAVANELIALSNQNYAPGNSLSWDAVKPKPVKKQGGFVSKTTGKKLPF